LRSVKNQTRLNKIRSAATARAEVTQNASFTFKLKSTEISEIFRFKKT
jgi:hypothetical protein